MSPTPDFDGMCSCLVSSPGHMKGLGQEETPVRSADVVLEERIPTCNTHGEGHIRPYLLNASKLQAGVHILNTGLSLQFPDE